jgi:hypothetical protein
VLGVGARQPASLTPPEAPGGAAADPAAPPGAPSPDDGATPVRVVGVGAKVVSPAWELELLISGAVTVALLQAPGAIADAQRAVAPHLAGGAEMAVFFAALYARAMVYALSVTFLLNLVARAYWVGLVGLQSVYPDGPRWERYRAGPFVKSEYRSRLASLPSAIARVDDFASVVFSFGFLIALVVLLSSVAAGVVGAAAFALARLVPGAPPASELLRWLLLALIVPGTLATLVDKAVGPRLAPDGAAARLLRAGVRVAYVTSGMWVFGPAFVTLFTNLRRRAFYPLFYSAFALTFALAAADFLADAGALDSGSALYVPADPDLRGVHAEHYESMRRPGAAGAAATIQSDVVTDPYLRVFIPYDAERVNAAVPRVCPDVAPQRPAGFHIGRPRDAADTAAAGRGADAALACLARLHAITLDGRPVAGLRLRFTEHPQTGQPGLVGMLPLAGVAPGEHLLRVGRPPREGAQPAGAAAFEIPFWR